MTSHPLDSAVWSSLTGPHAGLAERAAGPSGAVRYPPEISSFAALAPFSGEEPDLEDTSWAALTELVGSGGVCTLSGPAGILDRMPAGWRVELRIPGVQMIATEALRAVPDEEAVALGPGDVDEILDLVRRTEPGPFGPRTHELGTFLGIRRDGVLIAMAGERMHPPGWTEVSAVCTDAAYRGRGLAGRLIRAVAHGIRERGETPFLHAAAANTTAVSLYESLGFAVRRRPEFYFLRAPLNADARCAAGSR